MRRRSRPLVDVVDETFIRAEPVVVRSALDEPGVLDALWPGLQREVVQDRGTKGVRWRTGGEVTGRLEIWLEEVAGGTVVHHFVQGDRTGGPRRWSTVHRRRWKGGLHDIKDRLEGRRR